MTCVSLSSGGVMLRSLDGRGGLDDVGGVGR